MRGRRAPRSAHSHERQTPARLRSPAPSTEPGKIHVTLPSIVAIRGNFPESRRAARGRLFCVEIHGRRPRARSRRLRERRPEKDRPRPTNEPTTRSEYFQIMDALRRRRPPASRRLRLQCRAPRPSCTTGGSAARSSPRPVSIEKLPTATNERDGGKPRTASSAKVNERYHWRDPEYRRAFDFRPASGRAHPAAALGATTAVLAVVRPAGPRSWTRRRTTGEVSGSFQRRRPRRA